MRSYRGVAQWAETSMLAETLKVTFCEYLLRKITGALNLPPSDISNQAALALLPSFHPGERSPGFAGVARGLPKLPGTGPPRLQEDAKMEVGGRHEILVAFRNCWHQARSFQAHLGMAEIYSTV